MVFTTAQSAPSCSTIMPARMSLPLILAMNLPASGCSENAASRARQMRLGRKRRQGWAFGAGPGAGQDGEVDGEADGWVGDGKGVGPIGRMRAIQGLALSSAAVRSAGLILRM